MNQSVIWDRATGITIESLPESSATAGQVVLRVDASESYGTDIHIAAGEYPLAKSPVVLGHEYAARSLRSERECRDGNWAIAWWSIPTFPAVRAGTATMRSRTFVRIPSVLE